MPSPEEPRHVGHLGPHAIGSRVVVRRRLPGETGPSGGPALTDVLGVLESWADGIATVRSDRGLVEIRTSDIVSGKPVPPRPSPRQRVSDLTAEQHTARLWEGVTVEALGDWELRHEARPAGRRRKRANSALALGDPGVPLAHAAATVVAHYAALDLTPLAQVVVGSDEETFLVEAGWQAVPGDAHFLLGSLARARRASRGSTTPVELSRSAGRATASIGTGCDPVAEASATLDGDWLGLHAFHVDPAHRRRGHATALLAALLEWGAEQGATTAWLHVETDNEPALRLYEGLGLQVHHTCRYLSPP